MFVHYSSCQLIHKLMLNNESISYLSCLSINLLICLYPFFLIDVISLDAAMALKNGLLSLHLTQLFQQLQINLNNMQ